MAATCPGCGATDPSGMLTLAAARRRFGWLGILGAALLILGLFALWATVASGDQSGWWPTLFLITVSVFCLVPWLSFEFKFARAQREIERLCSERWVQCPSCGTPIFASRPICSKCSTRVSFSRPA